MKKTICIVLLSLPLVSGFLFGEINLPFFGNSNFTIDADTTFVTNLENGATGLRTTAGFGLWFEYIPYADRNLTPRRDALTVSLKLANSAIYAWRGYGFSTDEAFYVNDANGDVYNGNISRPSDVTGDQAMSIWFDTFIAQLEYNQYWVRIAGIEPEITLSQASIRSVFDPIIENRTAIDKNRMYLPLFRADAHYRPWPNHGIVSVIGRDLVNLNRREVSIAGNLSAGMNTENFDLTLKAGSWKNGRENIDNSWLGGVDFTLRPDLSNTIKLSFLGAINYGVVDLSGDGGIPDGEDSSTKRDKNDPMADPRSLVENPLAVGLGYDYRIDLPRRMVLRPYAGFDFIYETKSKEYDWEAGGGLQLYFRGTNSQFKRNTSIGGARIGDVGIPAALMLGANVNKDGIINGVVSFNEDPRSSSIPRFGGFLLAEFMNIGGKDYAVKSNGGATTTSYNDFLWAGMVQLEYLLHDRIMPYIFAQYMPAIMPVNLRTDDPIYGKDYITLISKVGCRFAPIDHFAVDFWYERNDFAKDGDWQLDNGLISVCFSVSL